MCGGLFLSKLKDLGAEVIGTELRDSRAEYTSMKYNIRVYKRLIEDNIWQEKYSNYFDAVTLWDVIEHVNYPFQTLNSAIKTIKTSGYIFIDTPCRDSFYHRFGELTYFISRGKCPTFLNILYSDHLYNHKQIFSTSEMKKLFKDAGIKVIELYKFHELSFPYSYYLKTLFDSEKFLKIAVPIVKTLFYVFRIRNKMLVVGQKSS